MAKTDWQMGDIVQPADLNQIGQEINDAADAAASAQQTADNAVSAAANAQDTADAAASAAANAQNAIGSHIGSGGSAHAAATTSQAGFMSAADKVKLNGIEAGAQVNAVTSVAGKTGAVTLTKSDVGLGSVQNYGVASQAQAEAGSANNVYMTPIRTKNYVDTRVQNNLKLRLNGGQLEYEDGGAWKKVSSGGKRVFTENGVFTVPAGVTKIYITACGGGGGGGGGTPIQNGSAGGATVVGNLVTLPGGGGGNGKNGTGGSRGGTGGGNGGGGNANTSGNNPGGGGGSYGEGGGPGGGAAGGGDGAWWVESITRGGSGGFGAGGAGGDGGGGGGGAACIWHKEYSVTPGQSIPITIGSGGAGGVGSYSYYNGGNGGPGIVIIEWY